MNTTSKVSSLLFGLFFLACSSTKPAADSPQAAAGDDEVIPLQTLSFVGPCTPSSCGEYPSDSKSGALVCAPTGDTCSWTESDPNGSVSYRSCEVDECGAEPDETVCPEGTTFTRADCGSENEGACVWHTSCTFPRSTTPCADADGCGPMPEIGVICKDGSPGGLVCVEQSGTCRWERDCD